MSSSCKFFCYEYVVQFFAFVLYFFGESAFFFGILPCCTAQRRHRCRTKLEKGCGKRPAWSAKECRCVRCRQFGENRSDTSFYPVPLRARCRLAHATLDPRAHCYLSHPVQVKIKHSAQNVNPVAPLRTAVLPATPRCPFACLSSNQGGAGRGRQQERGVPDGVARPPHPGVVQ